MTYEQVLERMRVLRTEIGALAKKKNPSPADEARHDDLMIEMDDLVDRERNHRVAQIQALAANPANVIPGDDQSRALIDRGDESTTRTRLGGGNETRDQARRALENLARSSERLETTDQAIEKVTRALDGYDGANTDDVARWTAATIDPAYESAFRKLLRDPQNGHREFSDRELAAFQHARQVQRAMSLTDSAGGYMVPFQLDPSIILTSDGSINPIRRIAKVVTATGDKWNGVSSAGVTASWDAEAAEVSDDAPTLAQPSIDVFKLAAFVPISIEAHQDAANVDSEVGMLLADAKEQLEAEAFVSGAGTTEPIGITTALDGTASDVPTATADVLVAADLFGLQAALPPRFQGRAAWTASLETINEIHQMETTNGARLFPELAQDRLLRKPLYEASYLDAAGDTATAGNDYVAVYGDWSNYVIADRIGTTVEFIPHLFHTTTNRPSGQRGWYMFSRVGADSVNDAAFRMLVA
ncbi:MAG: phage major capsid protein [Chloroflexi bacterium]|nr:phage major capsid protein [Chloroflexota bacterium]